MLDVAGLCPICEAESRFVARDPWFRDHLLCVQCGSLPRERALMATLHRFYPHWRELRIHESSPAPRGASLKLRRECPGYIGSHYEPSIPFGEVHPEHGLRSEDLERQTFADERFDLVITQDVFEHLFRPDLAAAEIARTLAVGGAHVFTAPMPLQGPSVRRARRGEDGEIEHLDVPVYHGNPIDDSGSLVTIDYGLDMVPWLDGCSGLTTTIVMIDDLSQGIRAELNEVLVSRKIAARLEI
ncbi:methyltransferase domain-containing protein [uncultured Caulobacter sp.]|uniref:methyltransferase domain-containing protein n=1 Tax=uncultured Caulobacter sp. TaxID=158749 RepID=UPI00262A29F6|nr:methyltransferase domain-containing protein [uncultured Caulobacter sp.]